jgi:hypothetical protein
MNSQQLERDVKGWKINGSKYHVVLGVTMVEPVATIVLPGSVAVVLAHVAVLMGVCADLARALLKYRRLEKRQTRWLQSPGHQP